MCCTTQKSNCLRYNKEATAIVLTSRLCETRGPVLPCYASDDSNLTNLAQSLVWKGQADLILLDFSKVPRPRPAYWIDYLLRHHAQYSPIDLILEGHIDKYYSTSVLSGMPRGNSLGHDYHPSSTLMILKGLRQLPTRRIFGDDCQPVKR